MFCWNDLTVIIHAPPVSRTNPASKTKNFRPQTSSPTMFENHEQTRHHMPQSRRDNCSEQPALRVQPVQSPDNIIARSCGFLSRSGAAAKLQ
jgi:hypothetical protein